MPASLAQRPRLRGVLFGTLLGAVAVWFVPHWNSRLPIAAEPRADDSDSALPAELDLEAAESTQCDTAERVEIRWPQDSTEPRQPVDPAWQREIVSRFSVPRALLTSPAKLQPQWLFRNQGLNPRDTWLPYERRQALAESFRRLRGQILLWQREVMDRGRTEFLRAIAANTLQPVRYEDYVRSLTADARTQHEARLQAAIAETRRQADFEGLDAVALEARLREIQILDPLLAHGFEPYLAQRFGDRHYACRLADLPDTALAVREYEAALRECLAATLRHFQEAGALTAAETQRISAQLEDEITTRRPH